MLGKAPACFPVKRCSTVWVQVVASADGGARANTTASQSRGASLAEVDQTKLRRLSQIRLNALESGTAHEASAGETKKLRYALSVEGMALSDVFAQLAVDTSRLSI